MGGRRMKMRCECGRPALVLPRVRKKSSSATRAGRPTACKGHPLCYRCWIRERDSLRGGGR